MNRILPSLVTGLVLGASSATVAQAVPGLPSGAPRDAFVVTVDWHPSTSHWDHHYGSHMRSTWQDEATVLERRRTTIRNPAWSDYRRSTGRAARGL